MSDDVNEPADTSGEDVQPEPEVPADESEAADDAAKADAVGDDAQRTAVEALIRYQENASVFGRLVVHYESRDVTFVVDGASALRMLAMFARRRPDGLDDKIDPVLSSAGSSWVVFDLREPLAMSWEPGLPEPRPRTAVDPAVPTTV